MVLFDCDWFDPNHGTQENKFVMVEVKHAHRLCGCDPFVLAHQVEQVYYMPYCNTRCYCISYSTSTVTSIVFIQWWLQYKPNSIKMVFSTNGVGSF
jgi:hypothetical protein